jgi:hypothetical protein
MTPLDSSLCTRVPLTYLESHLSVWCDPRPPWSQFACKLTSPFPCPFPTPNGFPNSIVCPPKTTSRHRLPLVRHNRYKGHKQCWYLVNPPSWHNDFLIPGGRADFPQPPWPKLPELDLIEGFGPLKARTLLRVLSNTLSWFLTVLRGTLALHSSTAALLSSFLWFFLTCSFLLHWLRKCDRLTFR